MRLLLDTAVLIFALRSPDRLSRRAADALASPQNVLEVSSISLTEIAVKASLGKLDFPPTAVHEALAQVGARVLSFTADHAFRLFSLPVVHRDPFDRQIIAQSLSEGIPVVTPDRVFGFYEDVNVLW